MPMPPRTPATKPSPEARICEFYDHLKLSDKVAGGVFANCVSIRYTGHEFAMDFICNFFPRAVVNARVFVPAGRIRELANAVVASRNHTGYGHRGT